MKNKRGISLVILIITIIVMTILAGSVVTVTTSIVYNSRKAAFGEDLQQIQDAVETYYINNKTLPIKYNASNEEILYNLAGFKALLTEEKVTSLEEELTENKDETTDLFYVVDLAKLEVTSTARGNGLADADTANDDDIYLVSNDTKVVYYAKGEKIGSNVYFSITSKFIDITKIEDNEVEDPSTIELTTLTNIKITKDTEMFTNNLTVNIYRTTELGNNESLVYKFDGTGIEGNFTAVLVNEANTNISLNSQTITGDNLIAFNANKKILVQKINTSTSDVIQSMTVPIDNLDIAKPAIPTSIPDNNFKYYIKFNTISFNGISDNIGGSGLKELRYEYVEKLDEDNNLVQYYETPVNINEEYLMSLGKKADIGIIKLPKEVKKIKVAAIDNAGNISEIKEYSVPAEPITPEV